MEYTVVTYVHSHQRHACERFEESIRQHLAEGWQLHSQISLVQERDGRSVRYSYAQAMVKTAQKNENLAPQKSAAET